MFGTWFIILFLNSETGLLDYSTNNICIEIFLIVLIYLILFTIILFIFAVSAVTCWGILIAPKLIIWATGILFATICTIIINANFLLENYDVLVNSLKLGSIFFLIFLSIITIIPNNIYITVTMFSWSIFILLLFEFTFITSFLNL